MIPLLFSTLTGAAFAFAFALANGFGPGLSALSVVAGATLGVVLAAANLYRRV